MQCEDLKSFEQDKLDQRIKLFKDDTKKLTKYLNELNNKDEAQISTFNRHYKKCVKDYDNFEVNGNDGLDIETIQKRNKISVDDDASTYTKDSEAKEPNLKKQDTYKKQISKIAVKRIDSKVLLPSNRRKSKKQNKHDTH